MAKKKIEMKINIKATKRLYVLWNLLRWLLLTIAIYSLNVIAQISPLHFYYQLFSLCNWMEISIIHNGIGI